MRAGRSRPSTIASRSASTPTTDVTLRDFVDALRAAAAAAPPRARHLRRQPEAPAARASRRALRVSDVLWEVNRFLHGKRDYLFVAESGDALFAGLDVRVEGPAGYFAQGFYASMGFGVPGRDRRADRHRPAAAGAVRRRRVSDDRSGDRAGAAPRRQPDRAAAQQLGGWGIFRPVADRQDLLDLPTWPYAELARSWGGAGVRVETVAELRDALAEAGGARHSPSSRRSSIRTTTRRWRASTSPRRCGAVRRRHPRNGGGDADDRCFYGAKSAPFVEPVARDMERAAAAVRRRRAAHRRGGAAGTVALARRRARLRPALPTSARPAPYLPR